MWIILLFSCVSVILPNNAQELTSFETQTATEAYANEGVNRDSATPPVKLQIRKGRTDNKNRENAQNPGHPVFYSDHWQPILMPIGFNSNRDTPIYINENEPSIGHQPVIRFLRRPELEENYTVPHHYLQNEFYGSNVHYRRNPYLQSNANLTSGSLTTIEDRIYPETLPNDSIPRNAENIQPFDLYRNIQSFVPPVISVHSISQSSFDSNAEKIEINSEPKQLSLTAVPDSIKTDLLVTKIKEDTSKPSSIDDRRAEEEVSKPDDFYRNRQRYFPQIYPAYFIPNHYPSFQRNGVFRPIVPYPSNEPRFDRQVGPVVEEHIQGVPIKQDLPGDIQKHIPRGMSSNISPIQSIPLPAASRYPFGIYPLPFIPPFTPNIPPSGFPLTPLHMSQPRNVQRTNIITNLRSSPIVPLTPVPGVVAEVLAQKDNFTPEEQTRIIPSSEVRPEETIFVTEQNQTKIPYEFGYNMNDGKGNDQHRKEISDISGVVTGSYGFKVNGTYREVMYMANETGFHVFIISNEPGLASSSSAGVVVMAERPPIDALAKEEPQAEITAAPDANTDPIGSGNVPESN